MTTADDILSAQLVLGLLDGPDAAQAAAAAGSAAAAPVAPPWHRAA